MSKARSGSPGGSRDRRRRRGGAGGKHKAAANTAPNDLDDNLDLGTGTRAVRLQKFLSACGYCSRRRGELLIEAGLVLVDGVPAKLGSSVIAGEQHVTINGDAIEAPPVFRLVLHKPRGFITAVSDTHERLTVMDLLPRRFVRAGVAPVGRLDLDTSGLLLMTNDGDLAHRVAHPSFSCPKTYRAEVTGRVSDEEVERLRRGVQLDDGPTLPARVVIIERGRSTTMLELILTEGRKRQVRRMCESVGHPVQTLSRIAISAVQLGALRPGEWRELTPEEHAALRH